MTLTELRALPLPASLDLEQRVERAYAAFIATMPKGWVYDRATNCNGFVQPWEYLNGIERDGWRVAVGTALEIGT